MPILMSVRNMALAAGALALILTGAWINGVRWESRQVGQSPLRRINGGLRGLRGLKGRLELWGRARGVIV